MRPVRVAGTVRAVAGILLGAASLFLSLDPAGGQEIARARLDVQRGSKPSFDPRGPGVLFGPLDPAVQRWYVPYELYHEYGWRHSAHSNYARYTYQRYVDTALEGSYFYDSFGDYVSRGWLIYDWRQDQPGDFGSSLFKGEQFDRWFSGAVVSADAKGQHAYAITVGNNLRTVLTPLTFSKPSFNGVQIDYSSDRVAATVLTSRISDPGLIFTQARAQTYTTGLIGGRVTAPVGDHLELGATFVDARHSNTNLGISEGHFIAGNLSSGQSSRPANIIIVVLGDDSPEDEEGGAALFGHNVRITVRDFDTREETVFTQDQVVREGLAWPQVFGGFPRGNHLAADGEELIVLNYDFTDIAFQLPQGYDISNIVNVEFDYVLANDYTIRVWSDRHAKRGAGSEGIAITTPVTAQVIADEEPALLPVRRAQGNVRDLSNMERYRFEYGLPTASAVAGFTVRGTDIWGFDLDGEWDRSVRYFQYPNATLFRENEEHKISSRSADAWYLTLARSGNPYFMCGEAYSLDHDYSTSAFVVNRDGGIFYDLPAAHQYEFVDDNDDQDLVPEWVRSGLTTSVDNEAFPGWDENGDFISDFNQNDNAIVRNELPDFEEPFLRHGVDRPEFLFGIDLNNNGWIDRFEDDDLADYPYKTDRRGYNLFVGAHITPEMRLLVGRTDERMLSEDRDNRTAYALFSLDREYAGLGRIRIFDMLKRASDSIPDDRRAITFTFETGRPLVEDVLPAQDTWVNTAWFGFDYTGLPAFRSVNKLKYELYRQRHDDLRSISAQTLQETSNFFGLINKCDYEFGLGRVDVQPRAKSEFLWAEPFLRGEEDRREWTGTLSLIARFPVLSKSVVTTGLEYVRFEEQTANEENLVAGGIEGETGDQRSFVYGLQFHNISDYLGYRLNLQLGFLLNRTSRERVQLGDSGMFEKDSKAGTAVTTFMTVYAGVQ